MQRRSTRSSARQAANQEKRRVEGHGGFEEEAQDDYEPAKPNFKKQEIDNDDAESTSSEEFEPPPLMVLNRSKRANAGNLMAKLLTEKEIEKKEGDEVYESLWGGFLDVENDHNFEVTAADNMDADDDSNSELDEQDSNAEDIEDDEAEGGEEGDEPKRKKRKVKSSWLLQKMSETTVSENVLSAHEQQQRLAQCKKIAEKNRMSLEVLKQKQYEEQKKHAVRSRARHLDGPKEVWYSDRHITYMLLPEVKQWIAPKLPTKKAI